MNSEQNSESILTELTKKMKNVEQMVYQPGVYLSDYFYQLRNEIDIQTETLILADSKSEDELNQIRDEMLKEIEIHEKACLDTYKLVERSPKVEEKLIEFQERIKESHSFEQIETISDELNYCNEINSFQFELMKERKLFFLPSKVNAVGCLFVFEHERINDLEIGRIK